eukprot:TRINITY_DN9264_c0_g2_i1.p1 TRINITY_DN9264_c0_g2~~TRINITY_DN9264_c0_g2_i1.p1  ORF type:complete len:534 (-),score=108.44 TRINITY_DN9264_c0_g2_i1:57-1658(-)
MIDYSEDWLIYTLISLRGSVAPRACTFAIPVAAFGVFLSYLDVISPGLREDLGLLEADKSQLWAISCGILLAVIFFRITRAMARFWEGTGLLHQMRGEWFDSVSCCVTFSRAGLAAKQEEVLAFRHTIVRLMSLCHGSALKEIGGSDASDCETIDPIGLDIKTWRHIQNCTDVNGPLQFNRVEVLLHLIQSLITASLDSGVLKVPPPILSRVYQTLSRGFVNLLNAKKISDTRFPFPFAQLITVLILVQGVMTPMMVSCLFDKPYLVAVFTFIPIFGICALNFIGVELENPFGQDANDLPLDHFQEEMNNCLLMLLHPSADFLPGVDERRCVMDIEAIREDLGDFDGERHAGIDLHSVLTLQKYGAELDAQRAEREANAALAPQPPTVRDAARGSEPRQSPAAPTALQAALPEAPAAVVARETSQAKAPEAQQQEEPKIEEKLKTQTLLQGVDRLVVSLRKIKDAVQEQSKQIRASSEVISEFGQHLERVLDPTRLETTMSGEDLAATDAASKGLTAALRRRGMVFDSDSNYI